MIKELRLKDTTTIANVRTVRKLLMKELIYNCEFCQKKKVAMYAKALETLFSYKFNQHVELKAIENKYEEVQNGGYDYSYILLLKFPQSFGGGIVKIIDFKSLNCNPKKYKVC